MAGYSPLASAAAGATNPFGLPIPPRTGSAIIPDLGVGGQSSQSLTPPQQPRGQQKPTAQTSVLPIPITPATTPGAAAAPTATMNTAFDLQTDPALQQVNALAGLSDQQANAQALQQRQQQLLAYGDPKLAAAVLGQNDPTVQAAGQNQESQLAMLGRERDQNLRDFETQLDPSLAFSGYRVGQEQRLGQAYQDALAQAAAGVQGNLGTITNELDAALGQNNANRMNALDQAAADRTALIMNGLGGGTTPTEGGTPPPVSGGGNSQFAAGLSPLQQAVLAGRMPGGRATIIPPIAR